MKKILKNLKNLVYKLDTDRDTKKIILNNLKLECNKSNLSNSELELLKERIYLGSLNQLKNIISLSEEQEENINKAINISNQKIDSLKNNTIILRKKVQNMEKVNN